MLDKLKLHETVLVIVDQPATVGTLPVAVGRDEGVFVAYLPGLAIRHIANLHAGEAKTDVRDAYIIAQAARSLPHTLRSPKLADGQLAELTMSCGFDMDLPGQITQVSDRIRGLLTKIHPTLELIAGTHRDHQAMLDRLKRYPPPAQPAALPQKQLAKRLVKMAPRMGKTWAAEILQALSAQTAVALGTQYATIVLPRLAQQLAELRIQRDEAAKEFERLVLAHPLHPVLTRLPEVGVKRTAANFLINVVSRVLASAGALGRICRADSSHTPFGFVHPK